MVAQIVSGIGFGGGGLTFARGLTTAAIVWMTAAVGMARGAGAARLAVAVTATRFVVVTEHRPPHVALTLQGRGVAA